jgi:xanthine dehydrogenase accessory factor
VFVEPVLPPPQLVVCGATPVATALVSIGAAAGFEVIVVDPDATTNRFPLATHVFSSVEGIVELARGASRERHVVAATHGQWDEAAIEGALRLDPDYIGLVASRTRYDATIADLIASGVTAERLKIVRSRPGLDLGAKTPAEVALGIVAEIVAHRRHVQIPDPERERESLPTALVEDPICGMMVSPETSIHWLEHDGTTWHYCNARCRRVHAGQLGVVLPTQATR